MLLSHSGPLLMAFCLYHNCFYGYIGHRECKFSSEQVYAAKEVIYGYKSHQLQVNCERLEASRMKVESTLKQAATAPSYRAIVPFPTGQF